MLLFATLLLAQVSTATPAPSVEATATPAATAAPAVTAAPVVTATPTPAPAVPRPTLGPDRPGARFGSNPAVDLTDPRNAALELGHRKLDEWDTEGAIKIYKKFVKKNDGFADGHFWLGLATSMGGDVATSCAELRRYLKMEPTGFYAPAAKKRSATCPAPGATPTPTPVQKVYD